MGSGRQSDLGDQDDLRLQRERIDQLERLNAQLRDSEERFQILFEHAPDGYYLSDLKGTFVDGNAAAERITGYKREELIHASFLKLKLLSARDLLRAASLLARNVLGQSTGPDEFTMTRKDGTPVPVEIRTHPARIGNRRLVLGIARDITERKRAEMALRLKNWAIEAAINGMAMSDLAGSVSYVNPAFVRQWGYGSPAEILGRSVAEFWQMGDKANEVAETVRAEGGWSGDLVAKRKDGVLFDVHVSSNLVLDATGQPVCMQASFEDITERKRAEDALRESEDRYRSLVGNVPGIIFTIDLAGKITFVSRRTKEMLGYESAEVINRSVLDFIPEEERQRAMESIQKGMTGEGIKHFQTPMIKKSGERLFLECSFARVRKDGRVIGAQGTAVDITERKGAEDALRQSERDARQRAEELRMIGQVSAAINTGLDLEQLMRTVLEQCQLLFPIDTFYIVLYDAATDSVSFPFMQKDGERRSLPSRCLRAEPGLLEQVIRGGQTIHLPDAARSQIPMIRQPGIVSQSIVAVPMTLGDLVIGVLSMQSQLPDVYSQEQIRMFERLAAQVAIAVQNSRLYEAVSRGLDATLAALGRAAEKRDPYTAGHQRRVTDLALAIARKLDYGEDACSTLRTAGMLHDIGKLGVPAEILSKPTALSKIELELIRTHPQAAYEILADIAFPGPVAEIVLQHHERQDGSGYPKKISGDDILPAARILAVADVVEAMASHRPYRPALGIDVALKEIRAGRGTRYDQQVVDACVALFESGEFSFQPASEG